ncbi:MAG TPA: hypothetical protein DCE41_19980 [Cytophagales bacterium]|nr:hypothetical protein [Cytophagales bacterium]HAA22021.1 hypothetical protein [Cytophagales bacterium]HAP58792.1 hypothetical protein [Cytophagales bacterium]
MTQLIALWHFERRLILPAALISVIAGAISRLPVQLAGLENAADSTWISVPTVARSYLLLSLVFHGVTYELRKPQEYHFYHNLGLGRIHLWATTAVFSLIIGLLINLIL